MATAHTRALAPYSLPSDAKVIEIDANRYGNHSIASGSFGEVSIGLYRLRTPRNCRLAVAIDDIIDDASGSWGYAAIKTVRNAVVSDYASQSPFGGDWGFAAVNGAANSDHGRSTTSVESISQANQLTKEAYAELAALRAISSENPCIVPLLAAYPSRQGIMKDSALSLVFPYCMIDLSSAIARRRKNVGPRGPHGMLSDSVVKAICRDILSGLDHCHRHGFIHGDVNPANFVVSSMGRVQLADFGLACRTTEEKRPGHALCALSYRAPELMLGETRPIASGDIWGAGLILSELLTLRIMFTGRSDIDQLNRIFDVMGTPSEVRWPDASSLPDFGKIRFDPREPRDLATIVPRAGIYEDLRDLLRATIALDPASRSSAKACLEMIWLSTSSTSSLPADPSLLLKALVPQELTLPPISLVDEADINEAKQRAVAIAASRRKATKSNEYRGHDYSGQSNSFHCRLSSNGLCSAVRDYYVEAGKVDPIMQK